MKNLFTYIAAAFWVALCLFASVVYADHDHPDIPQKCIDLTTPPYFVRVMSSKTEEEYYKKSVASARRCCPQLNEDGDISDCSCPLVSQGGWGLKKFLKKQKPWCDDMIDSGCIPEN